MAEQKTGWFSGLGDFLGGVGDFAIDALEVCSGVYEQYKDFQSSKNPQTQIMPKAGQYYPNISASDIFAQPNYYLLFGGLALLIVALFLMKK